ARWGDSPRPSSADDGDADDSLTPMLVAVVILGHGASATAASMRPHVEGLRARGVEAEAVDLPKGRAERAVEVFAAAAAPLGGAAVVGGHSYGGRGARIP